MVEWYPDKILTVVRFHQGGHDFSLTVEQAAYTCSAVVQLHQVVHGRLAERLIAQLC